MGVPGFPIAHALSTADFVYFAVTACCYKLKMLTHSICSDTMLPMSAAEKTIEAMRRNPLDWRIDDLLSLARKFGIEVRNDGGSHHVFSHAAVTDNVSIPARRPLKPVYVRKFVALIDKIKESP